MLNRLSSFNMEIKEDDPLTRWNQKYLIPKSLVAPQSNVIVSFTDFVKSLGTVTKRGGSAKRNTRLNKRGDEDYMPVWVLLVNSSKCPTPQHETWLNGTLLHRELPSSHPSPISKYATCTVSEVLHQAFSGSFIFQFQGLRGLKSPLLGSCFLYYHYQVLYFKYCHLPLSRRHLQSHIPQNWQLYSSNCPHSFSLPSSHTVIHLKMAQTQGWEVSLHQAMVVFYSRITLREDLKQLWSESSLVYWVLGIGG